MLEQDNGLSMCLEQVIKAATADTANQKSQVSELPIPVRSIESLLLPLRLSLPHSFWHHVNMRSLTSHNTFSTDRGRPSLTTNMQVLRTMHERKSSVLNTTKSSWTVVGGDPAP